MNKKKAIKDTLNHNVIDDVILTDYSLYIYFVDGKTLEIDIDQINWTQYKLRIEVTDD